MDRTEFTTDKKSCLFGDQTKLQTRDSQSNQQGRQGEEGEGDHGGVAGLGDRGDPSPHSPLEVLALWHEQLLSKKDKVTQQGLSQSPAERVYFQLE